MAQRFLGKAAVLLWMAFISPHLGLAAEKIPVFVSIAPQKYFVEQIGGEFVDVRVMVEPGASPATYEPSPGQMAGLSRARIYFSIGVPFENAWLEKIAAANPGMGVVRTDLEIRKAPMESHHDHGGNHEGILDPHTWLAPPLVKLQARAILEALQETDPARHGEYQAGHDEFVRRVDELDAHLRSLFAGKEGLRFLVFHPAWGYFARAYGLQQVPIEMEGKHPKPSQLKELIASARSKDFRVVFVQPQFSTRSAEVIAREIQGEVAFADPLAEDWEANLRRVAEKFEKALR